MKESIKDIFHTDLITKTKSGIYDLVTGVKNLFRHNSANPEETDKKSINNYLKSPEEIEAEFRFLSTVETDEHTREPLQTPPKTYTTVFSKTEFSSEVMTMDDGLPDFMEENY